MPNTTMIYTPTNHIPIGEAVTLADGSHAIRIKNHKTKMTDEISLECLLLEVVQKTKAAETRNAQGLAAP